MRWSGIDVPLAAKERRNYEKPKTKKRKKRGYGFGGGSYGLQRSGDKYGLSSAGY